MTDQTTTAYPLPAALAPVAQRVRDIPAASILVRARGGKARGVEWVEMSGRGKDGAWYELRIHNHVEAQTLKAGLLGYQPLVAGGRTCVIGEGSVGYPEGDIATAQALLAGLIGQWIERAGSEMGPMSCPPGDDGALLK